MLFEKKVASYFHKDPKGQEVFYPKAIFPLLYLGKGYIVKRPEQKIQLQKIVQTTTIIHLIMVVLFVLVLFIFGPRWEFIGYVYGLLIGGAILNDIRYRSSIYKAVQGLGVSTYHPTIKQLCQKFGETYNIIFLIAMDALLLLLTIAFAVVACLHFSAMSIFFLLLFGFFGFFSVLMSYVIYLKIKS